MSQCFFSPYTESHFGPKLPCTPLTFTNQNIIQIFVFYIKKLSHTGLEQHEVMKLISLQFG